jgi:antitoxin MazE
MQVAKWGNSLAVRIPAAVVEKLGLKEGDEIEITASGRSRFDLARKPSAADRLSDLRRLRGALPKDFTFSRDEANRRR